MSCDIYVCVVPFACVALLGLSEICGVSVWATFRAAAIVQHHILFQGGRVYSCRCFVLKSSTELAFVCAHTHVDL